MSVVVFHTANELVQYFPFLANANIQEIVLATVGFRTLLL